MFLLRKAVIFTALGAGQSVRAQPQLVIQRSVQLMELLKLLRRHFKRFTERAGCPKHSLKAVKHKHQPQICASQNKRENNHISQHPGGSGLPRFTL